MNVNIGNLFVNSIRLSHSKLVCLPNKKKFIKYLFFCTSNFHAYQKTYIISFTTFLLSPCSRKSKQAKFDLYYTLRRVSCKTNVE